jgi:pimeloyl-ACP methyl ester carboxylesterase
MGEDRHSRGRPGWCSVAAVRRVTGFADSDGERIYWESVGAGDPPLVLCHGAGGNHAIWFQQVPTLAAARRVLTFDQRGFGRSTARTSATTPALAVRDLGGVLAAAGVAGPIDLVGQSMGGWCALGFAVAHPGRVRRLVLADTPGGIATNELARALAGMGERTALPPDERDAVGRHPALAAGFAARSPERAYLYQMVGAFGEPEMAKVAPALFAASVPDAALAALAIPVLFVVGAEDALFPPDVIRASAAKVPGAQVVEIARAGHSPYFEEPAAWNRAVSAFLAVDGVAAAGDAARDWAAWHDDYDRPGSFLAARLALVQMRIRAWLDRAPAGPLRAISLCAGEGRDLLAVLASHPRGRDVAARLVERDPRNAAAARAAARGAGLANVEVVEGDAGATDAYAGAVPADLALACGVFGNVSDTDIDATIGALPSLCAPGATVIWTRHRTPPDRTPAIRAAFAAAGFAETAFDAPDGFLFGVSTNRLAGTPAPFAAGRRLFTFVDYDALRKRPATAP